MQLNKVTTKNFLQFVLLRFFVNVFVVWFSWSDTLNAGRQEILCLMWTCVCEEEWERNVKCNHFLCDLWLNGWRRLLWTCFASSKASLFKRGKNNYVAQEIEVESLRRKQHIKYYRHNEHKAFFSHITIQYAIAFQ